MDNPKNRLKQALRNGQKQIGLWSTLSSNYTVEVLAGAGFDWVVLDTEHSPADLENLLGQLQAIAPYPTSPVVRVPWNDMVNIKRVLDLGAQSLLIPQINTAEEARNAVSFTRYPPDGLRGVAGATRGTRFGRIKNYFKTAHEELCVILQIESREALDNLEAIAAVEGVDGLFIGPADLHASLGYPGERARADVQPIIEKAIKQILKAGKFAGILTDEAMAQHWINAGSTFVGIGSDVGILARGAEAMAAKFKS
jgi:4-hydroxy-2-oxoheptanedioate aldolase